MPVIVFILHILVVLLVCPLVLVVKKSKVWSYVVLFISLFVIISYNYVTHNPIITFTLFPNPAYIYWQHTWFFPFAFLFFLLAFFQVKRLSLKIEVLIVISVLVFMFIRSLLPYFNYSYISLECLSRKDSAVCIQSTGWSCGPAALVNFLGLYNVPATEREMAKLARTEPYGGTTVLAEAYALKRKIDTEKYRVILKDDPVLENHQVPFIANIKLSAFINHAIVVLSMDKDNVYIIDSLGGRYDKPKNEFIEDWDSTTVSLARIE